MKFLTSFLAFLLGAVVGEAASENKPSNSSACRNIPGSSGYPDAAAWNELNATISGRLVDVVPSAKYCASLPGGACTDAEWSSALFRLTIPGAMDQVNWEQGYDLTPPSLCLRNATTCGQGDVPIYSVEAETVADIQAAVKFASTHNLRAVIKSCGHDYLGRSTAPNSLLIRTSSFKNISFTDSFFIGSEDMGSAVTVGSGAYSHSIFEEGKANGKVAVASSAATICTGAGYVQGQGTRHCLRLSVLELTTLLVKFKLVFDQCFNAYIQEFHVVVASGELLQVNSISHPDLFYSLRGGGAGSWGVLVSATFRTFPTFNATSSVIVLIAENDTVASSLATIHARHIFDWDSVHAGQFFWFIRNSTAVDSFSTFTMTTHMPNTTTSQSKALLASFLNASLALPGISLVQQEYTYHNINDALYKADDTTTGAGDNISRLSRTVGKVYKQLLDSGAQFILGNLVAGGKVAENANISSAVHPAWRTAKSHLILLNLWEDSASLDEIRGIRKLFQTTQVPIIEEMTGPNAGAYSNEADLLEPDFRRHSLVPTTRG
ncbi:FAD-binding domain-containing protein [Mycena leptocephala]|nr:FAD-binding domain-containing protein [Mycena leptocephala]